MNDSLIDSEVMKESSDLSNLDNIRDNTGIKISSGPLASVAGGSVGELTP